MDGISNKVWSAQLLEESTGLELLFTLTDPDTLYLQEHYQHNGSPAVRTAVYEREYSFFPEISEPPSMSGNIASSRKFCSLLCMRSRLTA